MIKMLIFFVSILQMALVGCESNASELSDMKKGIGVCMEYYFKMSDKDVALFENKIRNIKLGDDYNYVVKYLGDPDEVSDIYDKQIDSKYRGRIAKYYLAKLKKELVNENCDKYAMILFDVNDQVVEIKCVPDPVR